MIFKSQDACEEFGHAVRVAGLADYVTVKKDNSIKRNNYDVMGVPHEIVLSYRKGNEKAVKDFCRCLKGRAYVNPTCGTHFHIDMRNMDEKKVTLYGTRIAHAVPALRLLLPKERRENQYCKTIINTTKTECVKCGKLSCDCHVQPHKYAFVNLAAWNKHKTIEVRGHSGTINADKILNWIALCEIIMLSPEADGKTILTVNELIKSFSLDEDLAAYVIERFKKFADGDHWDGWSKQYKTEGEETPDAVIDIPVHPAFLAPIPAAKQAQAAVMINGLLHHNALLVNQ